MDKNAQNPRPYKMDIYAEFVLWFAMPPAERIKLGIENQGQFAEYYKVSPHTLSRWKDRSDFETRVDRIQMTWGKEKTADVIQGIYRSAVKGNPASQLLWLQYFKKFNPKQEVVQTAKVELTPRDIRFIIEGFPTEQRGKYYEYIREIVDTAAMLRSQGLLEDAEQPADDDGKDEVEEAAIKLINEDKSSIPDKVARTVFKRHMSCMAGEWERSTLPEHYQGAAKFA